MNFRNRLFSSPCRDLERRFDDPQFGSDDAYGRHSGWSYPEAEIFESEDGCEVRVPVPGLEPESVVVEIGEDMLMLSGLRWEKVAGEERRRLLSFRRMVDLPDVVDEDRFQALYDHDVLVVRLFGIE